MSLSVLTSSSKMRVASPWCGACSTICRMTDRCECQHAILFGDRILYSGIAGEYRRRVKFPEAHVRGSVGSRTVDEERSSLGRSSGRPRGSKCTREAESASKLCGNWKGILIVILSGWPLLLTSTSRMDRTWNRIPRTSWLWESSAAK
jgi:hypothetical protein